MQCPYCNSELASSKEARHEFTCGSVFVGVGPDFCCDRPVQCQLRQKDAEIEYLTKLCADPDIASLISAFTAREPTDGDRRMLLQNIANDLGLTITIH